MLSVIYLYQTSLTSDVSQYVVLAYGLVEFGRFLQVCLTRLSGK